MVVWFIVTFTAIKDAGTLVLVLVAVCFIVSPANGDGDLVIDCLAAILELKDGGMLLDCLGCGDDGNVSERIDA